MQSGLMVSNLLRSPDQNYNTVFHRAISRNVLHKAVSRKDLSCIGLKFAILQSVLNLCHNDTCICISGNTQDWIARENANPPSNVHRFLSQLVESC